MDYAGIMRILLLLICFLPMLPAVAEVYRSVNEKGEVIYTDKPSPGAEQIEVDEVQTIDAPAEQDFEYTPPQKEQPQRYTKLEITSPANDADIRENTGNVTVNVSLEPALHAGDQLVLYMDGAKVSEGTGSQFNLTNLDRGTHSLSVAVVDASGKELKRSKSIEFHLKRVADLDPNLYKTVDENGNVIFTAKPSPGAEQVEIKEISPTNPPKPKTPPVSPTNPPKPPAPPVSPTNPPKPKP